MDKLLLDVVVENSLLHFFNALECATLNGIIPGAKSHATYKQPYVQEMQLGQEPKLCYAHSDGGGSSGHMSDVYSVREVGNGHYHQQNDFSQRTTSDHLRDTSEEQCDCVLPDSYSPGFTKAMHVMHRVLGFTIEKQPSRLIGGGIGVVVTRGLIPKGAVLAMYPGELKGQGFLMWSISCTLLILLCEANTAHVAVVAVPYYRHQSLSF